MITAPSRKLTKGEFCNITHTAIDSRLFDLLGSTAFFYDLPCGSDYPRWYHAGTHAADNPYYGNFELHEDIREVWVDSKEIAIELDLEPRDYGLWFLWSKY